MAYRKPHRYFSFADLAVEKHADKNRSLALLKQLNHTIDWKPIDKLLAKFYHTGKAAEGGRAYPPLLLFKCLLLQKWFQIPSDPELESQINDRISFKSFLGLPIDQPAPDHSHLLKVPLPVVKSCHDPDQLRLAEAVPYPWPVHQ